MSHHNAELPKKLLGESWVLEKGQWESIHMTSALVFLILASIHLLVYNWKVFAAYLKPRASRVLSMRPELLFSLLAAVILFIAAARIFFNLRRWETLFFQPVRNVIPP